MMKNKDVSLIILLCSAVLTFTFCNNSPPEGKKVDESVPVKAMVVKGRDMFNVVRSAGKIEGIEQVTVISEVGGTIVELYAGLGRKVKAGDTLAVIDDRTISAQLKQAESRLEAAKIGVRQAEKDYNRYKKLLNEDNASENELELAEFKYKNAKAQLGAAQADYQLALKRYNDTRIKSPISGYISYRYVEKYQLIKAGTPIADVVNDSRIVIKLGIPEVDIDKVSPGQKVFIKPEGEGGIVAKGYVRGVSRAADASTMTYPVEIEADNSAHRLKSGMVANVEIVIAEYDNSLVVPSEITKNEKGEEGVFLVVGDKAVFRTIEIRAQLDSLLIVKSGLSEGDTVVIDGMSNLSPGKPVQLVSVEE